MKITIEQGCYTDIDELEKLYDEINDHLSATINFPGWIKGIYPTRANAVAGIKENSLFIARCNGIIVGSVILNHQSKEAYKDAKWKIDADYYHIFVIRTFVVHPFFLQKGIGKSLLDYSIRLAKKSGIKSIRLDVYENNLPAISLYEKCGFEYIGTVDLGLDYYGLKWFKLYEKIIENK